MNNVQLGTLVLNAEILVYAVAGMAAVLAMRLRRRGRESREQDVSVAWNAMMLWLVAWKGSLLLTDPIGMIRQPMSLLFFGGGTFGFWLATVLAAGYSWLRYARAYRRAEAAKLVGVLVATWGFVYLLARTAMQGQSIGLAESTGLFALLGAVILLHLPDMVWTRAGGGDERRDGGAGINRRLMVRLTLQSLGALLIIVLLGYTLHDQLRAAGEAGTDPTVGAKIGAVAPAIDLAGLDGAPVSLEKYRGKTVLLNFWTTWCRVCASEMPHVQKLYEHYANAGEDVVIVTVNVTSQEQGIDKVKRYAEERRLDFPVALDVDGNAKAAYRVSAYPTAFIVDAEGVIRERMLGAISYQDMRKRIQRISS